MEPAKAEQAAKSLSHKATGPRTHEGKQRSKYNAVKHGGLCKKLLIKGESQADNAALWNGLWEDLKPQGTLPLEIFMDIFMLLLNLRRYRKAKHAQIAERVQFSEYERRVMQQGRAWYLERYGHVENGMLKPGGNDFVLKKCLEILQDVRGSVEKYGFDVESNPHLLRKLYGTDFDGVAVGIYDLYVQLARCAQAKAGGDQNVDPDRFKRIMLIVLDNEISNITTLEKTVRGRERIQAKYEVDQSLVLPQEALELDMRYGAHFTRELARKLILFEQAQRMCKGLPVLPPVKVDDKL